MALLGSRDTREGFKGATCGSVVQETVRRELPGGWEVPGGRGGREAAAPGRPQCQQRMEPLVQGLHPQQWVTICFHP